MATATVEPLGDRVLVRVIARERVTTGGIILPDQAREQSDRGLVVAVGPGMRDGDSVRTVPVSEGDVVAFSPYAGSKVSVGDQDFLLLREHDVLGKINGLNVAEDPESGELRVADPEPVAT